MVYLHGGNGRGNTHEFGVEESLRKTIKQPGAGWAGYTCMEAMGGGSFALRRPRPYRRAFAGKALRGMALPDIYAHAGINGKRREGGNRRGAPRRYVPRGTGE